MNGRLRALEAVVRYASTGVCAIDEVESALAAIFALGGMNRLEADISRPRHALADLSNAHFGSWRCITTRNKTRR